MDLITAMWAKHHAPRAMPLLGWSTGWRDLGFGAVDLVCLTLEIEERFEIELPINVEDCDTIGALAALIDRLRAEVPHG